MMTPTYKQWRGVLEVCRNILKKGRHKINKCFSLTEASENRENAVPEAPSSQYVYVHFLSIDEFISETEVFYHVPSFLNIPTIRMFTGKSYPVFMIFLDRIQNTQPLIPWGYCWTGTCLVWGPRETAGPLGTENNIVVSTYFTKNKILFTVYAWSYITRVVTSCSIRNTIMCSRL